MVEVSADAEKHFFIVNVFAEVDVVNLIEVSLVHVSTQEHLSDVIWGGNSQQVEDTEELRLRDVTVLGDVKVLEDWFQVNSHVGHCLAVLVEKRLNLIFCGASSEILAAGEESVTDYDWGDSCLRSLINASDCECAIDCRNEVLITEELLRITGLVLVRQSLKLVVCQLEVHRGENSLELRSSDATFAQFVKVMEELLNSNPLHHNESPDSVFNISWVAGNIDARLTEAIVKHIDVCSWLFEEHALLVMSDTQNGSLLSNWVFGNVGREHVFWTVDVFAEEVVVNVLVVAFVTILADHQFEHIIAWWHDSERLHNTQELGRADMVAFGAVKVHECWLEQDAMRDDLLLEFPHCVGHLILLLLSENLKNNA